MKTFNPSHSQTLFFFFCFFLNFTFHSTHALSILTSNHQFTSSNFSHPTSSKHLDLKPTNPKPNFSLQSYISPFKKFINSNQSFFNLFLPINLISIKELVSNQISNTLQTYIKPSNLKPKPIPPHFTPNHDSKPTYSHPHHQSTPTSSFLEPRQQIVWQVLVSVSVSVGIGISLVSTVGGYTTMSHPGLLSEV
ncbi:hypothetical protein DFH28DRAFT_203549 [Melampsora americana]|nr:hypothetical protein DFH28DRAFT_203549 [Melampsora americana]